MDRFLIKRTPASREGEEISHPSPKRKHSIAVKIIFICLIVFTLY